MYTIYLKNSAYKVFVSGVFLLKQCLLKSKNISSDDKIPYITSRLIYFLYYKM